MDRSVISVLKMYGEEGNVPVVKGNCRTAGTDPQMQRESMLSVCESIQYYSGGGRQGLFSGYESRDKQETGSIYAKEGHAGIFSPSGRELLSKCQ